MSLTIILDSGLGNQLFMLFTGISKALDEKIDFGIYPVYNTFRKFYFTSFLKSLIFKVVHLDNHVNPIDFYQEPHFHYAPIPDNKKIIKGYFQSYKYFHHNRNKILKIIDIQSFIDTYKIQYPSVAIHLRFGDMSFNQSNHIILRPSYFINAIRKLLSLKPDLIHSHKFIIYGEKEDDEIINDYIKIINRNLKNPVDFVKFYDLYPNMRDYQELIYMSSSQHLIIANSTFSWWSAYLCNNPDKIIIHPSKWFGINNQHNRISDIFPPEWIEVDVNDNDLKNELLYNL
jgi:hypothetical protein